MCDTEKRELARLLRELCDLQQGPPLMRYEDEWRKVMADAYELLKKVEGEVNK